MLHTRYVKRDVSIHMPQYFRRHAICRMSTTNTYEYAVQYKRKETGRIERAREIGELEIVEGKASVRKRGMHKKS